MPTPSQIDTPLWAVVTSGMEPVPYLGWRSCCGHPRWPLWLLVLLLAAQFASAANTPQPIQTIYVIPSSHWDLGFIRTPNAQKEFMKPHLDAVLSACEADPQFRWTIESGWQLRAWLDRTKDPAQVERMARFLRSGQIELSAVYGSMHTEFMGSEELNRLVSDGAEFKRRFGIDPRVAFMNDVPGFSFRLPQVLARSGVPYVLTGLNTGLGGGADLWPGKVPFYWESPDGSKILMWQTQGKNGGYTEGMADYYLDPDAEDPYNHTKFYPKEWAGLANLEIMQRGVDKLLKQYADAGYRKSIVAVLYMHDGIGPDYELKGLLPNVRAWNAAGRLPHIVVATPSEFFTQLQKQGLQNTPVFQGDWSGLWSEVKVNSPAMSADARFLQQALPEAETLWSLLKMKNLAADYPDGQLNSDYTALFEYDEHNGSGQGGWPKVLSEQEVREQNKEYADEVSEGRRSTEALLHDGVAKLADPRSEHSAQRMLLVYNLHSWQSSHPVTVSGLKGNWSVRDASTGAVVASQRLASGNLIFEANNLPPFGYRTYLLDHASQGAKLTPADPAALESPYFRVEFQPATGAILRIIDLRSHRTMLDQRDGGRAGTLLLNSRVFEQPDSATPVVLHHERGAAVDQLVVTRPNSLWAKTVIALPRYEPVVRFTEVLDRSKMRFVGHTSPRDMYAFAFDFSFKGKVQRWVENGEGLYRFPDDLLPGVRQDGVVPRHTLVWSEEDTALPYFVMVAEKQSFFNRYEHHASSEAGSGSSEGAEADVMIKNDQAETRDHGITTFQTYEPGYPSTYTFSFALTGGAGKVDAVAAHDFEVQDESDFIELPEGQRPAHWAESLLSLSAPNVAIEVLKPSSDGNSGDYLLRLQEIAGKATDLSIKTPLSLGSIEETTLTEDRVLHSGMDANAIHIAPYQTLTLRLSVVRRTAIKTGVEH